MGIGFLARAFLTTDLDFFSVPVLRRVFAIVRFLLEVFAFLFAFEAVLLRVFLAIVDPQCRTRLYSEHRRRMGHRARGVTSALGQKQTFWPAVAMSALPPKADIVEHDVGVAPYRRVQDDGRVSQTRSDGSISM